MSNFTPKTKTAEDPWAENAQDRAKASRAILINARARTRALLPRLPELRFKMTAFIEDLTFLEQAYAKDPGAFRRNRALTAVHLPGIVTSLEALAQMHDDGTEKARLEVISADITACFAAASQAKAVLQAKATPSVEIETAVLKAVIAPAPKQDVNRDLGKSGIFGQLDDLTRSGTKSLLGGFAMGRSKASEIGSEALGRVGAGTSLAKGYLSGMLEDGVDMVTSPVARRISAIGTALSTASASALVSGLVTAVIFPPAVPFAVGLAVLGSTALYSESLRESEDDTQQEREAKKAARSAELDRHLNKLRGRSPIVRMETPYVHVVMNAETGQSQGIILTGRHAGEALADFDVGALQYLAKTAPDDETRQIIEAWVKQDQPDPEKKDPSKSSDGKSPGMGEIGLDLLTLAILP